VTDFLAFFTALLAFLAFFAFLAMIETPTERCNLSEMPQEIKRLKRYPYKRSHLVALRTTKISARDPPSTWWPGER